MNSHYPKVLVLLILLKMGTALCAAERPNILFLFVDDQRYDTLGCTGHPVIQTPNIDKLAESGLLFENAFVNTSICMASRATTFTGLTQRTHGYRPADPEYHRRLNRQDVETSLPKLFKDAGYQTGFFGKNHVNFDYGVGGAFNDMFHSWQHYSIGMIPQADGSLRHSDELVTENSLDFLKERPKEAPFFLYMSFTIAHAVDKDHNPGMGHFPWPSVADGLYEDIEPARPRLDDPAIFEAMPGFLKRSLNRVRYFWRWDTGEKYITNMRSYYRMLTGLDSLIGQVVSELEAQGVLENTIIIYTSDNGYYMGERGFAGKWSHFEESIRVPLIVNDPRVPEVQKGRVESAFASNVDLPATMLTLAGLPVPEHYQGRSLSPFVAGHHVDDWSDSVFIEHHQFGRFIPGWAGVRVPRYTYARYDRQDPDFEFLHDLELDPDQLVNLANDPTYAPILEQLRAETDTYIAQYSRSADVLYHGAAKEVAAVVQEAAPAAKVASQSKGDAGSGEVMHFDGSQSKKLIMVPELSAEDSATWEMEVNVLPGSAAGGILMGNRRTPGSDSFLKITPSRGVQLFKNGRQLFKINANIPQGQWTSVRLEKVGTQFSLYLNDVLAGSAQTSETIPAMPCYLGGDPRVREFSKCMVRNAKVTLR